MGKNNKEEGEGERVREGKGKLLFKQLNRLQINKLLHQAINISHGRPTIKKVFHGGAELALLLWQHTALPNAKFVFLHLTWLHSTKVSCLFFLFFFLTILSTFQIVSILSTKYYKAQYKNPLFFCQCQVMKFTLEQSDRKKICIKLQEYMAAYRVYGKVQSFTSVSTFPWTFWYFFLCVVLMFVFTLLPFPPPKTVILVLLYSSFFGSALYYEGTSALSPAKKNAILSWVCGWQW